MQCISGCVHDRRLSIMMALRRRYDTGKHAEKQNDHVEK
jgi:hypothetical protein